MINVKCDVYLRNIVSYFVAKLLINLYIYKQNKIKFKQ